MRKTHAHPHLSVCLLVLVFVLVALSWNGRAQTQQPLARRPDIAAAIDVLDAWIQSTAAIRDEPGLSIGVVYDQDLIWTNGYGWQDRDKRIAASPNTLYRIASISKLLVRKQAAPPNQE